jgi:PAS domain S-box-containing protein
VRSPSARPLVVAVAAAVLAAAITAPFFFVAGLDLRLAVAAVLAAAVGALAWLVTARARRAEAARVLEQRRLRETVDGSDEARRDIVDALPLITWHYEAGDRDTTSFVSSQVETMLGFPRDEWAGALAARVMHPDDRTPALEEIDAAIAAGAPFEVEYRVISRGGDVVWIREKGTTVRDRAGKPRLGQSFLLDIGDRVAAVADRDRSRLAEQAALAQTAERQRRLDLLRAVVHVTASAVDSRAAVERSAALIVRDFADWCVVDLGGDADGATRGVVARATPPHGRADARPDDEPGSAVREVIESGQPKLVPGPGGDPPASDLDSFLGPIDARSLICVPLRTSRRSFGAISVSRSDVARPYGPDELALVEDVAGRIAFAIEHSQLEEEVERSADAAHVLAHVGDGVVLLDRGGIVRFWNPAAEAITAIAAVDVLGRPATEVIAGWPEAVDSVPVSSTPDPGHAEVVIPIETAHGERWIAIAGVEFFGGTVYAFRDLTGIRELEELKAEFIATASHELRTPLAAVYGAAQTLLRHDFALDEGGRDRFVSLIADESERLGRIVNEILLASQLDTGKLALETEPFDPGELVDRVIEATRAYAPASVTVARAGGDGVPRVDADRDKVRQVLVNLVENAIKYSPDGGRIEIRVEPQDDAVLFSVSDEGLGIPNEEQSRVFEKFYRLDPQMTRGVGGTGLGLYICNELVTRMGGHIWVESAAGEGSTFLFELPATATATALAPAGPSERATEFGL